MLYAYYCAYGQFDSEGNHVGLFAPAAPLTDDSAKDIDYATFRRMQQPGFAKGGILAPAVVAAAPAAVVVETLDALMETMVGLPLPGDG